MGNHFQQTQRKHLESWAQTDKSSKHSVLRVTSVRLHRRPGGDLRVCGFLWRLTIWNIMSLVFENSRYRVTSDSRGLIVRGRQGSCQWGAVRHWFFPNLNHAGHTSRTMSYINPFIEISFDPCPWWVHLFHICSISFLMELRTWRSFYYKFSSHMPLFAGK